MTLALSQIYGALETDKVKSFVSQWVSEVCLSFSEHMHWQSEVKTHTYFAAIYTLSAFSMYILSLSQYYDILWQRTTAMMAMMASLINLLMQSKTMY